MFTGIIEEVGSVTGLEGQRLTIAAGKVLEDGARQSRRAHGGRHRAGVRVVVDDLPALVVNSLLEAGAEWHQPLTRQSAEVVGDARDAMVVFALR